MTGEDPRVRRVMGQLRYLIDELQAQKPFLKRIPEAQLEGVPFEGESSIQDMYRTLAEREWNEHLPFVGVRVDEPAVAGEEDVGTLLDRAIEGRKRLIKAIGDVDDWSLAPPGIDKPLLDVVHRITLADAESLREIGQRFYESNLSLRERPLGNDPARTSSRES